MRLMFVCGDTQVIGGIEKYNDQFINSLRKAGVDPVVVVRYSGGMLAILSFVIRFLVQYILVRPNYIFCGHLNFAPLCAFVHSLFGTPYSIALHSLEIIYPTSKMKYWAVEKAQMIITISDYAKKLILDKFPGCEAKLFMHTNTVDGERYLIKAKNQILVEKYNLKSRPVILTLSRLSTSEEKGQDRVLKALPAVIREFPDLHYLIVGAGEDTRVTEILKKSPDLLRNVTVVGTIPEGEKADYYNLADVFVLPSKFEGFGIVFVEALACGIPVIATDAYGSREVLRNGELGVLINPDDINAIAQSLIAVLKDRESNNLERRHFLRQKALEHYDISSWEKRVANWVKIISAKP